MEQEVQRFRNGAAEDVGGLDGEQAGAFAFQDRDTEGGLLEHLTVVCAVADGDGGGGAKLADKGGLLWRLWLAGLQARGHQLKLIVKRRLTSVGVCCDHDNLKLAPQTGEALLHSGTDMSILGDGAVHVQHKVPDLKHTATGDVQRQH